MLASGGVSLAAALCCSAAYAAGPTPIGLQAAAVDAAASAADAPEDDLGAIVVTAQRRSEDVKDVPLSVSVLTGDELEKRGISNFEDLARITPGVAIYNTGGSNLSRIFIRGVSSTQGTATVAVYLDDVSLTAPNLFFTGATLPRFMDIDHVETLRGPQGTLFGASALSGALRFISNKPDLNTLGGTFRGDVSATKHAGANYVAEAVLNVPLVDDKLAWRVAIQTGKTSGFVDRYDASGVADKAVNEERQTAIRTTMLYQANDAISIEPALLWQKTSADGTSIFDLNSPRFQQRKRVAEPNSDELFIPSLTIHAALGEGLDLTSVSSYLSRTNHRQFDSLNSPSTWGLRADPARGTLYNVIASLPGPNTNNVYVDQWSQELRLGTPSIKDGGNPYELQIGGFFSNQKVKTDDFERVTGLSQTIQTIRGVSAETLLGAPVVEDKFASYTYTSTRREFAIFAEGSYEILNGLKLTLGGRQSFTKVDYEMIQSGPAVIGSPPITNRTSKESPFTPKFAVTYEASREVSFYGNVSKGYRLGGENNPLPDTCTASLIEFGTTAQGSYGADSLWSYEGGAKMRLFGNRLTLNASGYYIDWKNIQQSVSLPSCGYVTTVNAGTARSYGGEAEISARLSPELTVGATGSFVNAKISDAAAGSGTAKGQWLLHVPNHSYTGYVDFEPVLSPTLTGLIHVDANFIGKSHGAFAVSNPDYNRPGYAVVNANLGLRVEGIELALYAQNLLNQNKIIQRPAVYGVRQGLIVRPRTIGLNGKFRF
jgi:outer membrane receptor protein involved in Fe transport